MALDSGTRLGPYEILDLLGAGGMGEVYRARDTRLRRDVALKVLAPERARDPARLRRFETEARAVAALDHPHILALHDLGSENGHSYVVFELVEGETLRHKLEQGSIPLRKCLDWGAQICRGLAAAHARAIVHRDLKPENISITPDGRVKILDFGLAKLDSPLEPGDIEEAQTRTATEPGMAMGTIGYMAPEQVRGRPADPRFDIFAVGAILYEMLTGRRAFQGASAADTLSAILNKDPPEMISGSGPVPPELELVVRRCLEKDPEQRFQSARDLAFALERTAGLSSSGATPLPPPSPRSWWTAAALALAAAGLGWSAFVLGARRPPHPPPGFRQLTFRRGQIVGARFTPDGNTVVYGALFDGHAAETYSMRLDQPEPLRLDFPAARLMSVSNSGELALALGRSDERRDAFNGILARAPLAGGSYRQVVEDVFAADWAPNSQDLAVIRKVNGEEQLEYPVGNVLRRPLRLGAGLGLRVSPRGDKVAFTCWDGSFSVTVFDRSGATQILKTEYHPGGLAWDPSGDAVWTLAGTGMQVSGLWRLGLDGSVRLVYRIAGAAMLHDVAPDGRLLISIGVVRLGLRAKPPDQTSEREVCPFGTCLDFDLSNDGRHLLLRDTSQSGSNWTLLQPTDGGPPVHLADDYPLALSPDGRWAVISSGQTLELVPTGPGARRKLNTEGVKDPGNPQDAGPPWFPDPEHLLIMGWGKDGLRRTYLLDVAGGEPKPVTPANVFPPPGPLIRGAVLGVERDEKTLAWYPLAGGEARPVVVRQPRGTVALRVTLDGQSLFIAEPDLLTVDLLDLGTGRRTPWKRGALADSAGVVSSPYSVRITPDGRAYAYGYRQQLEDLYLVEGVQ
jgi:eukaryotic-like serine/threonine-protein kinase